MAVADSLFPFTATCFQGMYTISGKNERQIGNDTEVITNIDDGSVITEFDCMMLCLAQGDPMCVAYNFFKGTKQ